MSDETQDEGCGAAMRKGGGVEDLYCGGPLVIDERIAADIQAAIDLDERSKIAWTRMLLDATAFSSFPEGIKTPRAPDIMAVTRDIARS